VKKSITKPDDMLRPLRTEAAKFATRRPEPANLRQKNNHGGKLGRPIKNRPFSGSALLALRLRKAEAEG